MSEPVVTIENIIRAAYRLNEVIIETPLQYNQNLSERYAANIYLKREDLQVVRSYKIRGAYNCMSNLNAEQLAKGVVCASAGNHAQGFAHSCSLLQIRGTIYMPATTPSQKIKQVQRLGKQQIEVVLCGDTYDAAYDQAIIYCEREGKTFIHPFDDLRVIEGQGTVGMEILNAFKGGTIDYLFIPIGGGGLCAGVGTYFHHLMPETKIIGAEPQGAPSMLRAFEKGKVVTLNNIDKFIDGAAVQTVGKINFAICQKIIDHIILIPEGKVCSCILQLYNEDAIVVEPAGALSIAALDSYAEQIRGKNVVCIVSGGNNDIERMPEIKDRSLIYEGLKHYFIIQFPQRAGAFREFLNEVLGPNDNIVEFEYTKKTNRSTGPALVGIEFAHKDDYEPFIKRMNDKGISYMPVNDKPDLFNFLI
jgi:threonine dehydratase